MMSVGCLVQAGRGAAAGGSGREAHAASAGPAHGAGAPAAGGARGAAGRGRARPRPGGCMYCTPILSLDYTRKSFNIHERFCTRIIPFSSLEDHGSRTKIQFDIRIMISKWFYILLFFNLIVELCDITVYNRMNCLIFFSYNETGYLKIKTRRFSDVKGRKMLPSQIKHGNPNNFLVFQYDYDHEVNTIMTYIL